MRIASMLLACIICSTAFGQSDAAKDKCNSGIERYNQGELDMAIAEFTAAIALSPEDAFPLKCRSYVFSEKKDYDKALEDLSNAIALEPEDGLAYFSRGNLWQHKGEFNKALADYDKAIVIDPKNALLFVARGTLWIERGDIEKALSDYNDAIKIDPEFASAYSGRAWIMATSRVESLRNGARALEDAIRANIISDWKQADQLDTLAAAYAELGKFGEAIKYQEKAIELATDEALVKDFRSRHALYKAGKPFRSVVQDQPASAHGRLLPN